MRVNLLKDVGEGFFVIDIYYTNLEEFFFLLLTFFGNFEF